MKLKKYLKEQKFSMPADKKLLVFDDIKTQITRQSIFLRLSFYSKVAVYSFFLIFVFFALFHNSYNKESISRNVVVYKEYGALVHADYIGEIIQFTGDFKIYDGSRKVNTKKIFKGDTLFLGVGSYLTIAVNKGIKLYVIGPAKVKLDMYKDSEGHDVYVFNMLDGDYISVKSNSAKDKIVIKSKYVNIESDDKYIDIKYEKKGKAVIVENNGGNILVKNYNNIINLDKKEKLIVLSSQDEGYIKNLFSDNYKKYQLSDGKVKVILSSSDIKKLGNILDKKFVIIATGKYVLGKLNKDKNWENQGKQQLVSIITSVYNLLKIKMPLLLSVKIRNNNINAGDLQALIDNLLDDINKNYVLPKVYINRLKVILAYMVILENVSTNKKFNNLFELVNYLKLDNKYKKMLLKF